MRHNTLTLTATLCVALLSVCSALNNGLGRTPPMGWNSWNYYHCGVNETVIRSTALAMQQNGLAGKGYKYVNIDDCWQIARDPDTGRIIPDPATFPSGIKPLADYVHSLGMKFGLYSDAGTRTCAGRPGSLGYETIDAQTYAEWEVDFLKYDNCHNRLISPKVRYPVMTNALNGTGRAIYFSMCEWGEYFPWLWAQNVSNSWRITPDISPHWYSIMAILDVNAYLSEYAAPGAWNDPDMLEVGNGNLTLNENQAHFALWAITKAPLIIGCDVPNIKPEILNILSNEEVIAVNQDPLGVQARRVKSSGFYNTRTEVWSGPLVNGDVAVILFNRSGVELNYIDFTWQLVGFQAQKARVRDLINKKDLGIFEGQFGSLVSPHSVVMLRLYPADTETVNA